jgi:hypothetical protein
VALSRQRRRAGRDGSGSRPDNPLVTKRNGVANRFMMFAPLEGWRRVEVTDHHATVDYANVLKRIIRRAFPRAEKIVLVQDNLSTHTPASRYAAFPAPEARRLVNRFEWDYTPKHGSWLDTAESELAVLTNQCLAAASPTGRASRRKSRPGSAIETKTTPKPTGSSRPKTPVSN